MSKTAATEACSFQPLGDYEWPALPQRESLRLIATKFYRVLRRKEDKPFIADAKIRKSTMKTLDDVAAPPACGPFRCDLDEMLTSWMADPSPSSRAKLIILPPCDENHVVESWARDHGHQILPPPSRRSLTSPAPTTLPDLAGEGVIVVPQLEHWFLRHRNGLAWVRALLAALDLQTRRYVIGCNSWAWAYLSSVVGADMILPTGLVHRAFDGPSLCRWFSTLAADETAAGVAFRLSKSGANVFALDGDGNPANDHFKELAAASLGIPWVAWHMWRHSLRSDRDAQECNSDPEIASTAGKRTIWVSEDDEFELPEQRKDIALLALHAILIHNRLTIEELWQVLPTARESAILPALVAGGFVERDGDEIMCRTVAYPAVREGMVAAAFPVDTL